MSGIRVVVETPCEHGYWVNHWLDANKIGTAREASCPGGSRRVLTPGSYLLVEKVDGYWPRHAIDAIVLTHADIHTSEDWMWHDFLDALADPNLSTE